MSMIFIIVGVAIVSDLGRCLCVDRASSTEVESALNSCSNKASLCRRTYIRLSARNNSLVNNTLLYKYV